MMSGTPSAPADVGVFSLVKQRREEDKQQQQGLVNSGSGDTAAVKKTMVVEPVHWVRDEEWFQKQASNGCCPYTKFFYESRYANVDYRCCGKRWWYPSSSGTTTTTTTTAATMAMIDPLRPLGGLDFGDFFHWMSQQEQNENDLRLATTAATATAPNTDHTISVLMQGDSLAEQHFLSLLCLAWSSSSAQVVMDNVDPTRWRTNEAKYVTHIVAAPQPHQKNGKFNNDDMSFNMTITFVRWDRPTLADPNITGNLENFDVLLLGGWHHGGTENLDAFLDQIQKQRTKASSTTGIQEKKKRKKATIVVEALPSHFPGGRYDGDQKYPPVNVTGYENHSLSEEQTQYLPVCDTSSLKGEPDINGQLRRWMARNQQQNQGSNNHSTYDNNIMSLLPIEHLFHHRGNAHIGSIPAGTIGPKGRDCLHYCAAPGVLDSFAKQTLGHMASSLWLE